MGRTTINYEVPEVQLVVQDKNMACWYASALMVLRWKNRKLPGIFAEPAIDDETFKLYKANNGVQNPQILPLAKRLGLTPIPPICPSIEAFRSWFWKYGPLWTNGISHIVVIAGIRGDDTAGYELKVYDPWPGNGIGWRSLTGWYAGFNPKQAGVDSRDTSANVEAVFLRA